MRKCGYCKCPHCYPGLMHVETETEEGIVESEETILLKYFIIINEYNRACIVRAPTAKDAVLWYEMSNTPKVRQVMNQPTTPGNHVDVHNVGHTITLS